ncbi:MAG: hypothetical protein AAFN10_11645 [Bacteroidota bacterium]
MKRRNARNLNLLISLTSLAILLLAGAGYYYIYVQNREAYLHQRHFRVLERIGENMVALNETYLSNAKANGAQSLNDLKQQVRELVNEEINRVNQARKNDLARQTQALNQAQSLAGESLRRTKTVETVSSPAIPLFSANAQVSIKSNRSFQVEAPGRSPYTLSFEKFSEKYGQRTNLEYEIDLLSTAEAEALSNDTPITLAPRQKDLQWEIQYSIPIRDAAVDGALLVKLSRSMDDFMGSIMREDVFQDFVILNRGLKDDGSEDLEIVYETFDNYFVPQLLTQNLDSIRSLQIKKGEGAALSELPYLAHLQAVQFNQYQLILCGLIEKDQFSRDRRKISTLLVLILLILVLLLVLGIPLLKLGLISDKERMKISDLLFATTSAIFGSSLLILLLFDLYTYNGPGEQQSKQQLVDLSEEISSSLFDELENIYSQLMHYDTLDIEHRQNRLRLIYDDPDSLVLYPKHYPFFTSVYWSSLADSIGLEWTVRPQATPQVSLSGREYLESVKEGRTWPLGKVNGRKQFMLESLLTRTNGEKLGVVSKSSATNLGPEGKQKPASAVFLTSYLYSVIQPLLPNGFGFTIVGEDGKVWFHSDKRRNLQHNFLEETDNSSIQSAIYNRSALYTSGTYLGEDYNFYIQPLDQLPLHLVTFRKKIYDRTTHEQIISLSFLLILISLTIGLGFVGLLALFNPSSQILKQDRYVFDWLRPSRMNRGRYQLIATANILTLLLGVYFTQGAGAPVALSIIALSFVYAFLIAFFLLNRNQRNEFLWQSHRSVVFTTFAILILFNLLLDAVLINPDSLQVRLFQLIPGFVLVAIIARIFYRYITGGNKKSVFNAKRSLEALPEKPDISDRIYYHWGRVDRLITSLPLILESMVMNTIYWFGKRGIRMGTQRSYRLFLLSWLAVIGIFPVIKFYEVAYNRELKLQIQHSQIQFSRDFAARSLEIDQRYLDIPFPDSLQTQLKRLGVYTQPYFKTTFTADLLEGTQVDIKYPVWRDTIQISKAVIRPDAKEYLLEITFDTCLLSRTMPWGLGRYERTGVASVFADQPNYQVRYMVWRVSDRKLGFEVRLERTETLRTNASEQLDYLYELHEKPIEVSFMINEQVAVEAEIANPEIITRRMLKPENMAEKSEPYVLLDSLFSAFRPSYNEIVRRSTYLNRNASADSIWTWYEQPELMEVRPSDSKLSVLSKRVSKLIFQEKSGLQLTSELPQYNFPSLWDSPSFSGTRFWIFFVVLVVIFYLLIDFVVYRFFAQNTLYLSAPDAVSARKHLKETQENIYLVVPPRPLETDYLVILENKIAKLVEERELPIDYQREHYYFDLSRTEDFKRLDAALKAHQAKQTNLPPLIILDNFESQVYDQTLTEQKQNVLDHLLLCQVQIIILSVQEPLEVSRQLSRNSEEDEEIDVIAQRQWSQLLSNFSQLYFPLEKWQVLSNQQEAEKYVQRKHSFLYLAEISYRSKELHIAGVSINSLQGKANMEKGLEYNEHSSIRIDQHIDTPYKLNIKLKKLKKWIESNTHEQITVLSCLNPTQIIQIYQRNPNKYRNQISDWKKLFDLFDKGILSAPPRNLRTKDRIREIIRRECAHGKFLQGIQNELVAQLDTPGSRISNTLFEEEIVLQIGIRAKLYYHALWNACSEDEQLLIYDLAQDGLMNSRNLQAIEALLRKGIFITDEDTIHLMNRSFRNFVLTVVKPEEAVKMEEKIQADATWSRAKIPIAIIVFALAAFLYYTDVSEVLNETATFVTAATALIPVITKIVATIAGVNLSFKDFLPNLKRLQREGD